MTTPTSPAPGILTPLSPAENLCCHVHDVFDGDGSGAFVVRLDGLLKEAPLRTALDILQQQHPKLRAHIVASPKGVRSYCLPASATPIPIILRDLDTDPVTWQVAAHDALQGGLDPAGGLTLKALVLHSRIQAKCDLILLVHHAIIDVTALLGIVDDLLSLYEVAEGGGTPEACPPFPLIGKTHIIDPPSLPRRIASIVNLVKERRAIRRNPWTPLPTPDTPPTAPMWDLEALSTKTTTQLVRRCRANKTTVYGALVAAAACGLYRALGQPQVRFSCRSPLDLRPQLRGSHGPINTKDLGCFIGLHEAVYPVGPDTHFWEFARHAQQTFKSFHESSMPAIGYQLLRFAKVGGAPPRSHRRATLTVSQLGVAAVREHYGPLRIDQCTSIPKGDRVGTSMGLMAITIGRRLNLHLSAVDVPATLWDGFRQTTRQLLYEAAGADAPD